VWEVFTRLSVEATIPDHLATLTQHHTQEQIQQEIGAPSTD